MTAPPVPPLEVRGGPGCLVARLDDLDRAAATLAIAAAACLGCAQRLLAAVPGGLLAGDLHRTAAVLELVAGPRGLLRTALELAGQAAAWRAARAAYAAAETTSRAALDQAGRALGAALGPALLETGAATAAAVVADRAALSGAERLLTAAGRPGDAARLRRAGARLDPAAALVGALRDDPALVGVAVRLAPGLADDVAGLLGAPGPGTLHTGLAELAALYPDGHAVLGPPWTDPTGAGAVGGLAGLLGGVARRDVDPGPGSITPLPAQRAPDGSPAAQIGVRVVRGTDGAGAPRTALAVEVPGTREWEPPPGDAALNDLGTNLHAAAGQPTAYAAAVTAAVRDTLRADGLETSDVPVLLVGHSQGGLVALAAAGQLRAAGVDVTHVVTAGSPIGRLPVPAGVHVLALEGRRDLVPALDAAANPARADLVTVTGGPAAAVPGAADPHTLLGAYVPLAGQVDGSGAPALAGFRASAQAFLAGTAEPTRVYPAWRTRGPA